MADEEERILEEQLEVQLQEQKDSLSAIKHALTFDPDNAELLSVEEELITSIKDAEEGLLGLKRARLLREADAMQGFTELHNVTPSSEDLQAEPLNPTDVEVETLEEPKSRVGLKCRFRHTDGRWHNGQIVELKDSTYATVSFLTPVSENTMMCKFFLQQRCRFGANCRLSHGTQVPLSSLKKYVSPNWGQSHVGATILAVSKTRPGIWRNAELKSWDNENNQGVIVFRDDGSSDMVGNEAIALSQRSNSSDDDDESDYLSHDGSSSSDSEEDRLPQGLGFVETTALQRGVQTDTTIFATWENHTRGVASKMMANMGYREGMGLGSSGQGMVDPIPVKVLPPKQSLEHALRSSKKEGSQGSQDKKKRSRGGKRKRDKKFAEAARAAKQEEEQRPDVFSLINSHLAAHSQMVNNTNNNDSSKKQKSKENKKEDRRSLIAYEEEAKELRVRVEKLEEMVNRNKKEKAVYEVAMRKLSETRKALAETEARHASASNALTNKDKEKKWLRF
ncbi:hypothetical protein KSS87_013705 [Heliosperma pusillum]|nr:hypothetical protein KSS87_013705 [Heliosperma pusillum]